MRQKRLKPTRDDARYQGGVFVWYPFHPQYNKHKLVVVRRFDCHCVDYLELSGPDGRQAIPVWMVEQDRCREMTCGLVPAANLAALIELLHWMNHHPVVED